MSKEINPFHLRKFIHLWYARTVWKKWPFKFFFPNIIIGYWLKGLIWFDSVSDVSIGIMHSQMKYFWWWHVYLDKEVCLSNKCGQTTEGDREKKLKFQLYARKIRRCFLLARSCLWLCFIYLCIYFYYFYYDYHYLKVQLPWRKAKVAPF